LLAAMAVSLLLLAAGVAYFIHLMQTPADDSGNKAGKESSAGKTGVEKSPLVSADSEKRPNPQTTKLAKSSPVPEKKPATGRPSPIEDDRSARKETVSPVVPPPKVEISRIEPVELRAGGKLTVYLKDVRKGDDVLTYQYRVKPEKEWRPAAKGRVSLSKLQAGVLSLELRAVDRRGRSSSVVTRTLTVKPSPTEPKRQVAWKEGDVLFQDLAIARVSSYRFLGTEMGQNVQYRFLSSFKVERVNADGGMVVLQRVEAAEFGNGDKAMQALLNDALKKTRGAAFKITLNAKREVTRFEGDGDAINVFDRKNPLGGQSFLLWSFMDRDGWKELAQVTLFRPDRPRTTSGKWARKMTHSWGPLGHWAGRVLYGYAGRQQKLDRIAYVLEMAYLPPRGRAPNLPFEIKGAAFKPQTAAGVIIYDADRDQVTAAEERFHVKGLLAVSALGVNVGIEMDEAQIFQLRILDKKPKPN
jgi:hypothetical protein